MMETASRSWFGMLPRHGTLYTQAGGLGAVGMSLASVPARRLAPRYPVGIAVRRGSLSLSVEMQAVWCLHVTSSISLVTSSPLLPCSPTEMSLRDALESGLALVLLPSSANYKLPKPHCKDTSSIWPRYRLAGLPAPCTTASEGCVLAPRRSLLGRFSG